MAHLLIFDALNLIRRIHSVQERQLPTDPTAQLLATSATLKRSVKTILQEVAPTHVIAVFDSDVEGWRKAIYPAYKEGRKPMPTHLHQYLNQLQDDLLTLGIDSLISETDEADDLIATLIRPLLHSQHQVTLISTDKGFCQLLAPGLAIRDYFNKRWLDDAFVLADFGLLPTQLIDYWALSGMSGTNIKGLAGIGGKTAQQLLSEFESIEKLLSSPIDAHKKIAFIQQNQDEVRLMQRLVRLKDDIPLGFNLKDIRYLPTESS